MVSTARSRLLSSRTSARACNTQSDLPSAASRIATAGFPGASCGPRQRRRIDLATTPLSGISTNTPAAADSPALRPRAIHPICLASTNAFKSTAATVRAPRWRQTHSPEIAAPARAQPASAPLPSAARGESVDVGGHKIC